MPSSLTEDRIAAPAELIASEEADAIEPTPRGASDIRRGSWIKRMLPRTMFGRSLLLIVTPLVVVQLVSTWVFYARHWETVSRRLSADVAGDIGLVIESMKYTDDERELTRLLETASALTGISFSFERGETLPPAEPQGWSQLESQLRLALTERVARPYRGRPY